MHRVSRGKDSKGSYYTIGNVNRGLYSSQKKHYYKAGDQKSRNKALTNAHNELLVSYVNRLWKPIQINL